MAPGLGRPDGSVQGLVTRGGFVVDITWQGGKIRQLRVQSPLGGNCRLRVHQPLAAAGKEAIREAAGDNPNPFFFVPEIRQPLMSPKASLAKPEIKASYVYDVPTQAGKTYTFKPLN